jgi:hypothetical protein
MTANQSPCSAPIPAAPYATHHPSQYTVLCGLSICLSKHSSMMTPQHAFSVNYLVRPKLMKTCRQTSRTPSWQQTALRMRRTSMAMERQRPCARWPSVHGLRVLRSKRVRYSTKYVCAFVQARGSQLFHHDIATLLTMDTLWTTRNKPTPLKFDNCGLADCQLCARFNAQYHNCSGKYQLCAKLGADGFAE